MRCLLQWLAQGRAFAARYTCPHLELACRLLDLLRKALELAEEAGGWVWVGSDCTQVACDAALLVACSLLCLLLLPRPESTGSEAALTYLARKAAALAREEAELEAAELQARQAGGGARAAYATAVARILLGGASSEDDDDNSGGGGSNGGNCSGNVGSDGGELPPLLQELGAAARRQQLPSGHQVAAALEAEWEASEGPRAGNRWALPHATG